MIHVLVAEDSPTVRAVLVRLLESDPDIRVIGEAEDGPQAVEMVVRLSPDIVTMDVVMPGMSGLEATRQIMAQHPTPILIVTAHADSRELNVAFEAIQAGALDVVAKPTPFESNDSPWESELVAKVKGLAAIRPWEMEKDPNGNA